jgi:hypothetical protein
MTGRRGRAYSRVAILPTAPDLGLLLVRTDYSDDRAWHAALSAATAVDDMDDFERMGALLRPVESPALSNLTPEELAALAREDYLSQIAAADAQTMRSDGVVRGLQRTEWAGRSQRFDRSHRKLSRSSRICLSRTWTPLSSPTTSIQMGSFADSDSPRHSRRRDLPPGQPPTAPDRMNAKTRGKM